MHVNIVGLIHPNLIYLTSIIKSLQSEINSAQLFVYPTVFSYLYLSIWISKIPFATSRSNFYPIYHFYEPFWGIQIMNSCKSQNLKLWCISYDIQGLFHFWDMVMNTDLKKPGANIQKY